MHHTSVTSLHLIIELLSAATAIFGASFLNTASWKTFRSEIWSPKRLTLNLNLRSRRHSSWLRMCEVYDMDVFVAN